MTGHLELICGLDANGASHLRKQSFCAPMHISKPHLNGETLVVNVVNPTAGLFEGDEIECKVHVETGAGLLLTCPSASRAHRMPGGGEARLAQFFSVECGAWLEVWPELFIPQGGACYRQKTTIRIDEGGGLLFFELLAPGRTASGETFAFERLDWETEIFVGEVQVVREKYGITPEKLRPLRNQFAAGYFASVFIFHPAIGNGDDCRAALDALHGDGVWIGHSRLHHAGWCVKVLASDSVRFRKTVNAARRIFYGGAGRVMPEMRRQ